MTWTKKAAYSVTVCAQWTHGQWYYVWGNAASFRHVSLCLSPATCHCDNNDNTPYADWHWQLLTYLLSRLTWWPGGHVMDMTLEGDGVMLWLCWKSCLSCKKYVIKIIFGYEPDRHDSALMFLSASLYFSKRGTYWDRLCRDVVGRWLVVTRVHCGQTVHPRPIVTMEH